MAASKDRELLEMSDLSDQELMRRVQEGDYTPAAELFERYSRRIYNFALRFVRNSEAAEDVTQEVFVKMIRNARQFQGDAKLSTWLFSITANHCRDHLRKADNKPKEPEAVLLRLSDEDSLSAEEEMAKRQDEERVRQALDHLTPEQREAILLSRYQGLSYAEIAQIAGCSEGAVKTRVFRAMETLKKVLSKDFGGERCLNAMQ